MARAASQHPNAFVGYTLAVGSVGTTFNPTGWRVEYLIGPEHLIKHVHNTHILLCHIAATPAQQAAAVSLQGAATGDFWTQNGQWTFNKVRRFCAVMDELELPVSMADSAV